MGYGNSGFSVAHTVSSHQLYGDQEGRHGGRVASCPWITAPLQVRSSDCIPYPPPPSEQREAVVLFQEAQPGAGSSSSSNGFITT